MSSISNSPIGIIDSGMGGITVWAEITRIMPHEDVIYWADTAHCPYGGRTRDEITVLVSVGVEKLVERGAKIIVIACNTATTAAIATLRQRWKVPFVGLEPAIKPAALTTQSGVVGVLGTAYTVQSEMFRHTMAKYAVGINVMAVAGNGLVEEVENEAENSPRAVALLHQYIDPMLEAGIDKLVLACTHFPLLTPSIREVIGERDVEIINPAPAVARHTHELLVEGGMLADRTGNGRYTFVSTGGADDVEHLRMRAEHYKKSINETSRG